MRVLGSKKKWVAATIGVAVIGTLATVALGEPGTPVGVTGLTFVPAAKLDETPHWNSDRVKFQTKDPTYVRVQKLVFGANSRSGWHHHPGIVIVAVESGTLTLTHSDCSSKTYGPPTSTFASPNGAVFVEGGDDPGQATSVGGATVYVTYVAPNEGSVSPTTFRIEDAAVSCP